MPLNNIYIIISTLLTIWGIFLTFFLLLNSSLKSVLIQTNRLIEKMDLSELIPKQPTYANTLLKRTLEICFSGVALILLSPLLFVISIAVKVESQGPIMLMQLRIGLHGQKFGYLKFRTMFMPKPADTQYESADRQFLSFDDYRITKVGRFLRKTGIDEMPALFNVLKGDISVVGRSRILDYPKVASTLKPEIQNVLLAIKPGLFSLWAVSYDRIKSKPDQLLFYDLVYLNRMSLLFDLMIIMRSIIVSFGTTAAM
jgi:lipopolysaccharide/colanic/teichoic acid biosynthesis glycosyltransferase